MAANRSKEGGLVFRAKDEKHLTHLNLGRIVEALIIAMVATLGTHFLTVPRIQSDVDQLQKSVQEVKELVEKMRDDLYVPRGAVPPDPLPNQEVVAHE